MLHVLIHPFEIHGSFLNKHTTLPVNQPETIDQSDSFLSSKVLAFEALIFFTCHGCSKDFRLGGSEMHNVDLFQKEGTYAMTVGHCQNQLGVWGHCKPPSGSRESPSGILGEKPPEAHEVFHFLSPENGLKTLLYVHVLGYKILYFGPSKMLGGGGGGWTTLRIPFWLHPCLLAK